MRSFTRFSARSCRCSRRGPRSLRRFATPCLLLIAASAIGCGGTKVLINQSGAMVRAGPDVKGRVYHWDGEQWVLSSNKVQVPEGWFIGPPE